MTRCRTCQLAGAEGRLSRFEHAALAWYQRNVTPLVMESGMLGRLVERLGLDADRERMFMAALNAVRQTALRIQIEDERR